MGSIGRYGLAALLIALGMRSFTAWAATADPKALVRAPLPGSQRITGLTWSASPPKLEISRDRKRKGKLMRHAVLLVTYDGPSGWSLIYQSAEQKQPLILSQKGRFKLRVPLHGPKTRFQLTSVGPSGATETEIVDILDPTAPRPRVIPASWSFGAGLGYSLISFTDPRIAPLSETALTAKASVTYRFKDGSPWNLGLSGYFTVVALTASEPANAIRFLGINGRVGYLVPLGRSAWTLGINSGIYFTTMFAGSDEFGFKNMMGPQLFPTLTRVFSGGQSLTAYAKYSPVSDGGPSLSFSNRELATGLSFNWRLPNGHAIGVSADFATFHLFLLDVDMTSSSASFGLSYSL